MGDPPGNQSDPNPKRLEKEQSAGLAGQPEFDDIAQEFTVKCRGGDPVTIEEYRERYPQFADKIDELFPAIEMMETLGNHEQAARIDEISRARFQFLRETIEKIGDFHVVREVGRGGMGVVYEAIQESLGRRVAVKVLPTFAIGDEESKSLKRFHRETRAAASLHHNNIVPIFGVGEHNGLYYFVMQFIEGIGIDQLLDQVKKQTDTTQINIREITETLLDQRLELARSDHRNPLAADVSSRSFQVDPTHVDTAIAPPVTPEADECETPRPTPRDRDYWNRVASIGLNVADALDHAHQQGVFHRDIKPSNLLIDEQGTVWVADFGLAKDDDEAQVTRTGDIVGTLQYMAPEQLSGIADARSDIYGLGATLFEMLTFQPIIAPGSVSEMIGRISKRIAAPSLRRINPSIPRDLETIVTKAVATNPDRRYQTASDLRQDLDRFLNDRPIVARRSSAVELGWRWCKRNPAVTLLSVATVCLLGLVSAISTTSYFKEAEQRRKIESTLSVSLSALDKVYRRYAPERIVAPTGIELDDENGSILVTQPEPVLSNQTAEILMEFLPVYDELAKQNTGNANLRRESAKALARIGEIQIRLGQYEQSAEALQVAINKFATLSSGYQDPLALAKCNNQLGLALHAMRKGRQAVDSHHKAIFILEQIETEDTESRFELARAYYFLGRSNAEELAFPAPGDPGTPLWDRGLFGNPAELGRLLSLDKAINILGTLMQQSGSTEHSISEIKFLNALCLRERATFEDPESLEKAYALLNELCEQFPMVADYQFELAETVGRVEIPGYPGSDDDDEVHALEQAVEISEKLIAGHPNIPLYLQQAAAMNHRLSEVIFRNLKYRRMGARSSDYMAALIYGRRAVRLQRRLVESPSNDHRIGLARMHQAYSALLEFDGRLFAAFDQIDLALIELKRFLDNDGDQNESLTAAAHRALHRYYRIGARLAFALGDPTEASLLEYLSNAALD